MDQRAFLEAPAGRRRAVDAAGDVDAARRAAALRKNVAVQRKRAIPDV